MVNQAFNPDEPISKDVREKRGELHNPLAIALPPNLHILNEAKKLAEDRNIRINKIAQTIAEDPIITLELLKTANALLYSDDRPAILNARNAAIRLGSGMLIDILESLSERPQISNQEVAKEFERIRTGSVVTSFACETIANVAFRDIAESAQTAGLMTSIGHMLACAYFGEKYLSVSKSRQPAAIAYRLNQDHNFDVEEIELAYLRMHGIAQSVLSALDQDMSCKTTHQVNLRFIVLSGIELIEAYEHGKWVRYSTASQLPSHSNLRLLKLTEKQYAEIFELITAYLEGSQNPEETDSGDNQSEDITEMALLAEIAGLDRSLEVIEDTPLEQVNDIPDSPPPPPPIKSDRRKREQDTIYLNLSDEEFTNTLSSLSEVRQVALKKLLMSSYKCKTADNLIARSFDILINENLFAYSALIRVEPENLLAQVVLSAGIGASLKNEIYLNSKQTLSTLFNTQIYSFPNHISEPFCSLFGSQAFAVTPIKVNQSQQTLFYVTPGSNTVLNLESRKLFRLISTFLNRALTRMPSL